MILALALSAHAWSPQTGAVWRTPVPWELHVGAPDTIHPADVDLAVAEAWQAWTSPPCAGAAATWTGRTPRSPRTQGDGHSVIGFLDAWPRAWGDPSAVIAMTATVHTATTTVEADVAFNAAAWRFVSSDADVTAREVSLPAVAAHELGHVLGLGHSEVPGAVMQATYAPRSGPAALTPDDVEGLCALYPTPLAPPDDDDREPDGDPASAAPIACGQVLTGIARDEDWVALTLTDPTRLTLTLTWDDPSDDLDLHLLDREARVGAATAPRGVEERLETAPVRGALWVVVAPVVGRAAYRLAVTCAEDEAERAGAPPALAPPALAPPRAVDAGCAHGGRGAGLGWLTLLLARRRLRERPRDRQDDRLEARG